MNVHKTRVAGGEKANNTGVEGRQGKVQQRRGSLERQSLLERVADGGKESRERLALDTITGCRSRADATLVDQTRPANNNGAARRIVA